jgi:hypothetical protein
MTRTTANWRPQATADRHGMNNADVRREQRAARRRTMRVLTERRLTRAAMDGSTGGES